MAVQWSAAMMVGTGAGGWTIGKNYLFRVLFVSRPQVAAQFIHACVWPCLVLKDCSAEWEKN